MGKVIDTVTHNATSLENQHSNENSIMTKTYSKIELQTAHRSMVTLTP